METCQVCAQRLSIKKSWYWCTNDVLLHQKFIMPRQSISFTRPNDEWLKRQIESKEYTSKSELINDLVRQARGQQSEVDWIRLKLESAEKSGFTEDGRDEILKKSRESFNG
ncbi:MAG: CopG family transcriptional regulator [Owenweeksia sp.]|nr:CopG family transcriptional regulator [Owenweeksia sp.]